MGKINYKNQWSVVSGQGSVGGKLPSYLSSPPILGGDKGVVIGQSNHPRPSLTKEGRGKPQGRGITKRLLLSLAAVLCLTAAPAHAGIEDYTAYPPFLPRVVSPNILFMLDYSKSMVRPAYINSTEIRRLSHRGNVLQIDLKGEKEL